MELINSFYKPLLEMALDPSQTTANVHTKVNEVIDKTSTQAKGFIPAPIKKLIPEERMKKIDEKIDVLTAKVKQMTDKAKLSSDKMTKIFEIKKSMYLIESGLAGAGLLALVSSSLVAIFSDDTKKDEEKAKRKSAKFMRYLFEGGLTTFGVLALTTATVLSEMEKKKRKEKAQEQQITEEEKNAAAQRDQQQQPPIQGIQQQTQPTTASAVTTCQCPCHYATAYSQQH